MSLLPCALFILIFPLTYLIMWFSLASPVTLASLLLRIFTGTYSAGEKETCAKRVGGRGGKLSKSRECMGVLPACLSVYYDCGLCRRGPERELGLLVVVSCHACTGN